MIPRVGAAATLLALFIPALPSSATDYRITPIPISDLEWGEAEAINNDGLAIGRAVGPSGANAVVWNTRTGNVEVISGPSTSEYAYGISQNGLAVGARSIPGGATAYIWSDSTGLTPLTPAAGFNSSARGVNETGDVTGAIVSADANTIQPFVQLGSQTVILTGVDGWGYDINNNQVVVGAAGRSFSGRAFRWTPTDGYQQLGTNVLIAYAINDAGFSVGLDSSLSGVLLSPQGAVLTNFGRGYARDINELGEVTGVSNDRPFLWRPSTGLTYLDASLVNGAGWSALKPLGLNDVDEIVGYGTFNNRDAPFVLTPVPEPAAAIFGAVASFSLATFRRRR